MQSLSNYFYPQYRKIIIYLVILYRRHEEEILNLGVVKDNAWRFGTAIYNLYM